MNLGYTLTLFIAIHLAGCTSIGKAWKSLVSEEAPATARTAKTTGTSFAQQNNLPPSSHRNYKRTKRKDIEDSAHLDSKSGSLWVMEGQGAYLFSQNVVRMIGDPIAVNIEGDPADQLSSKAKVISDLLAQLEERRKRALGRELASQNKGEKGSETPAADGGATAQNPANPAPAVPSSSPNPEDGNKNQFNVKTVPTRVVERLVDGNYRVRGVQPFMIGSREYKVIVSGIVRAEDFNDAGIAAPQLLDSNFDIVSSKSTELR